MSFPACVSTAVSVSSTTESDTLSSFADVSALTSLLAPGENIVSSIPGNAYGAASGTSMAAAQVAGAWAVFRQAAPSATLDQILLALQSTGLPISDTRSGGSMSRPRISLSHALSSSLGTAPASESGPSTQMAAGSMSPSAALSALAETATLALTFNGKLRDRVGQGNTALGFDGAPDGTLTATLHASGGRTITALRLDSDAPGVWDTTTNTGFWVLAVADTLDGPVHNTPGTMAVNFPVADNGTFVVFAADFQASEFLPGRTLTLTATFADGSTAVAVTTVSGGPSTLALTFNGKLRDRVGQGNTALGFDGAPDGTLTATLHASGGRTITALRLDSDAPGVWDTTSNTGFWVLAVADTLDGPIHNTPGTMAVNFPVADNGTFVVFAADFQASEFLAGRTLTLTATFADGSTAVAVTTVSGGPSTLALTFNGKLRDRVGQGNTALGFDGAPDGTLTATLHASGGRTITALRLDSDAPGVWDTTSNTGFWVLAVADTLDGPVHNTPGTMAVNFPVADNGTFVVFAADFQASEFLPGRTLTLTATFADGSTAAAVTTVSGGPSTPSIVASGLSDPTAMAFAPDGRLFVAEQGGQLRVIKNGDLLATPFVTVTTDSSASGACSASPSIPNFATNQFVYVYYTATDADRSTTGSAGSPRVGDVAVPGSDVIMLDLDPLGEATNHNGGAIHFGLDGKLYVARRRERRRGQCPDPDEPPRQDTPDQPRRIDPHRQSLLHHAPPASTAPSGPSACATRSRFAIPARHRSDLHQRRR